MRAFVHSWGASYITAAPVPAVQSDGAKERKDSQTDRRDGASESETDRD